MSSAAVVIGALRVMANGHTFNTKASLFKANGYNFGQERQLCEYFFFLLHGGQL